jgi:hypothetical protein
MTHPTPREEAELAARIRDAAARRDWQRQQEQARLDRRESARGPAGDLSDFRAASCRRLSPSYR